MAVGAQSTQQRMWDLSESSQKALSLPRGPLGLLLRGDERGLGVRVKGR